MRLKRATRLAHFTHHCMVVNGSHCYLTGVLSSRNNSVVPTTAKLSFNINFVSITMHQYLPQQAQ